MNRPRKTTRDPFGNMLPPRMYFHHGSYTLRTPDNRRINLGRDFAEALHAYAGKLKPVGADSMAALVEAWRKDRLPGYAPATREQYGNYLDVIKKAFDDFTVAQMLPSDVYKFCNCWKDMPRTANMYRNLLAMIFQYGASTSWPNSNPARQSLPFKKAPKRDRYLTDEEVFRIKHGALTAKDGLDNSSGPMVCAFIDLALATAQRVGDLLALTWSDWTDEGIYFHPAKTVNSTGIKLLIESSPALEELRGRIKLQCKTTEADDTVIQRRDGQPMGYRGIQSAWKRSCARAKVGNAHIHDLRAKALTDMDSAKEAQALAGHATEGMTAHYRKARSITKVRGAI